MKKCEYFYDQIIFYDDLSPSEQREVDAHTAACADCRQRLRETQLIVAGLMQRDSTGHVADELLTRYGIFLSNPQEPDYDGSRLASEEIAGIKQHLQKCHVCQQRVDAIVQEFREIDRYLEQAGVPALIVGKKPAWAAIQQLAAKWLDWISSFLKSTVSVPKFYPVAATAFAVILILAWTSPLFRGSEYKYHQLASLEVENAAFLTRDAEFQNMSDGLYAFEQGRYAQALEKLEQFIANNPEHRALDYAHYVAGLTCLLQAKNDFLGRFQAYDSSLVQRGIKHLQAAIQHSDNLRVKEDAYWFIGKAYLMKQQAKAAKAAFEKVQEMNGKRFQAAQKIIAAIEEIAVP
jgi:tetratricopeptide (TPR) repeat protein